MGPPIRHTNALPRTRSIAACKARIACLQRVGSNRSLLAETTPSLVYGMHCAGASEKSISKLGTTFKIARHSARKMLLRLEGSGEVSIFICFAG